MPHAICAFFFSIANLGTYARTYIQYSHNANGHAPQSLHQSSDPLVLRRFDGWLSSSDPLVLRRFDGWSPMAETTRMSRVVFVPVLFASCSRSHKCICNPFFGMSMIAALAMAESIQSTQEQLPAPRCFDVLPSSKISRLAQPHQQGSHQWPKVLVATSICRKSSSRSRLASPTMLNPASIPPLLCNPLRYHQKWGHLSQMAGNGNGLEWHLS